MLRIASIAARITLTALMISALVNCSMPGEIDTNQKAPAQTGTGSIYTSTICPARSNSEDVQHIEFRTLTEKRILYSLTVRVSTQYASIARDITIVQNQATPVDWTLGAYGRITSYTANLPGVTTVTAEITGETTPITYTFDCP